MNDWDLQSEAVTLTRDYKENKNGSSNSILNINDNINESIYFNGHSYSNRSNKRVNKENKNGIKSSWNKTSNRAC